MRIREKRGEDENKRGKCLLKMKKKRKDKQDKQEERKNPKWGSL
jgi:hypothetical protein